MMQRVKFFIFQLIIIIMKENVKSISWVSQLLSIIGTLTGYINSLLSSGFELTNLIEPKPPIEMRELEEMKNEMRRPMMLLISARNKKS